MTPNGLGWIIVDALDTMMLMNLTTELTHARTWLSTHAYDQPHAVNTFETTIRMLGGLLSAHYLSTQLDPPLASVKDGLSEDMYIEKATDLADRLLGAYESRSGVPYASVNLGTRTGIPSHADGGASSLAEATSLQLEMKYLAKVTGEDHYWKKAERVMKAVDDNGARDGLPPIYIYADLGTFRDENIRLGSRGDSYYEYIIKQFHQTSEEEPTYQQMWNESMAGIKKHLITYSSPSNFTVLAERPSGLNNAISPKVDHLVCFMPGTVALATTGGLPVSEARKLPTWTSEQEEDMVLAEELMKTCWGMYKVNPTGLAPEIAHFNIHDPPLMYNDFTSKTRPKSPADFVPANSPGLDGPYVGQEDYVIKPADRHNLQRPETVESLFYMWRITGDEKYRKWGWEMFQSFVEWTAVDDGAGFSSLSDVSVIPPPVKDNMESFWLVSPPQCGRKVHISDFEKTGRDPQVLLPSLRPGRCPATDGCGFQHRSTSLSALPTGEALQDRLGAETAGQGRQSPAGEGERRAQAGRRRGWNPDPDHHGDSQRSRRRDGDFGGDDDADRFHHQCYRSGGCACDHDRGRDAGSPVIALYTASFSGKAF